MIIFSQIHEIVYHGNGGYDWHTVYNMPLWLRKFTFEKIKEFNEKQQEEIEKRQQKSSLDSSSKNEIARPNIKPDYSFKASPQK
jgi:hypothetical protein